MRTTITLDDDIAIELEQLRRESGRTFKDVVNETLRAGLRPTPASPIDHPRSYTRSRPLGARVDISDISAVLGELDDEKYGYLARPDRP